VRIISGIARGIKLETLPGKDVRPTSDRAKEAFFNIIAERLPESRFADVFAGSGSMGCEALSRGAERVVFVEASLQCRKIIKKNIHKIRTYSEYKVYGDFRGCIRLLEKQDIVFLDPPYNKGLGIECLELISKYDILTCGGIVVYEHEVLENIPNEIGNLVRYDARKYGRCMMSFYKIGQEEK